MLLIIVFDVDVLRDLVYVKIFVIIYNSIEEEGKVYIKQFVEFKGFICSLLVKCICMCVVFDFYFFEDKFIIEGMCIFNFVFQIIVKDEFKCDIDELEEQE